MRFVSVQILTIKEIGKWMHIYVLGAGGECRLFLTITTRCLFGQGYKLAGYQMLRQGEFRIPGIHVY